MKAGAIFVVAWFACTAVQAAPFADPTQPPGATPDGHGSEKGATEGPRLQSVLISPNRRIAVIGGQTVPLGGMYGESRVIRITEGEVVLQAGQERQTLKLFSDVEKRVSRPSGRAGAVHKGARK